MDFSSQTRLKLRVAVCPFVAPTTFESNPQHNRVVGVKRDAGNISAPVILRQFLLLLPLDCTFSDLKSLTMAQYDKLYKSQANYLPLKSVVLFKDVNQCDLDWDYLIGDICSSNELVYAIVEVDESFKKVKTSNEAILVKTQEQTETKKSQPQQQQQQQQVSKPQNQEKKVPEFKPVPIKPPTAKIPAPSEAKDVPLKPVEVKKTVEAEKKAPQTKKVQEKKPLNESQEKKPVNELQEKKSNNQTNTPVIQEPSVVIIKSNNEDSIKESEPIKTEISIEPVQPISEPVKVAEPIMKEISETVLVAAAAESSISTVSGPENVITPVSTPINLSTSTSNTIFIPRKSPSQSNSSESSEDEDETVLSTFDATNLFGGPIIASEPRRSDPFVLFAAESSEDEEQDGADKFNIIPPIKSSSIVSLQAAPSSEADYQTVVSSSSSESDSETLDDPSGSLPHSVTLRRLSSVSPIPEPSEIPSLNELKESLVRAPTPSQIHQNSTPKKKNYNHHYNNNNNNSKRGRPGKKQLNGRPKVINNNKAQ